MTITVNKINNTVINGTIGSKRYSIPYDEDIYNRLLNLEDKMYVATTVEEMLQLVATAEEIVDQVSYKQKAISALNTGITALHQAEDGQVYLKSPSGVISSVPIPKVLVDHIQKAYDEGLPIDPFIKAWILFLRNPNFSLKKAELFAQYLTAKFLDQELYDEMIQQGYSEETAKEAATYNEVSITRSGLLNTYKYVQFVSKGASFENLESQLQEEETLANAEDYKFIPPVMGTGGDKLFVNGTLTHDIKVGAIHELPDWSYVNCDDNTSCVKGAHLGSQTYIRGYGGRTRFLMNCFVSPNDIGAFVQSRGTADEGALRVRRYFVHSVNVAPNKSIYHESTLMDKVEEDWLKEKEEAIAETNAMIARLEKAKQELNIL